MENIEFLLHGLRIMYSFIGTFLVITFGFAIGVGHLYKFCCKLKLCKYNYIYKYNTFFLYLSASEYKQLFTV